MNRIRTQRAWAAYGESCGTLFGATPGQGDNDIPVLVIPEADVKGCKHWNHDPEGKWNGWCPNCGAAYDENVRRWQRPRVLHVGRAKR